MIPGMLNPQRSVFHPQYSKYIIKNLKPPNSQSKTLNYIRSIPFSLDDISRSVVDEIDPVDLVQVEPPLLLRENSGFQFLLQQHQQ